MPDRCRRWFSSLAVMVAISATGSLRADPLAAVVCQQPSTQAAMQACAAPRASEADQALNQAYQTLRHSLPAAQLTPLLNAQLAWIRFRDAQCAWERDAEAGGSLARTSQLDCLRRLSTARTQELQAQRPRHAAPARAHTLIAADGIGPARLGMSLGALKASLPRGSSVLPRRPFLVDAEALPIVSEGVVQVVVLVPAGSRVDDALLIRALFTSNPAFRTREGVGPGMPLAEAAKLYGAPRLMVNLSDESRETVSFARQPLQSLRFGVQADGPGLAGVYPQPLQEYNQSERYVPSARISSVLVGRL
jgi:uncharacterized protein YecT (DUF1311 family)